MKKFKIFGLVLVLASILVLTAGAGCIQNAGLNQENEGLTPEEQIMPGINEPSTVLPPAGAPAEEIPAPVPPLVPPLP